MDCVIYHVFFYTIERNKVHRRPCTSGLQSLRGLNAVFSGNKVKRLHYIMLTMN